MALPIAHEWVRMHWKASETLDTFWFVGNCVCECVCVGGVLNLGSHGGCLDLTSSLSITLPFCFHDGAIKCTREASEMMIEKNGNVDVMK